MDYRQAEKLKEVCYDIRGPVMRYAQSLEEEGYRIFKLNIGNPAPFGFFAPDEVIRDVILNIKDAEGYSDSKGLLPRARRSCSTIKKPGSRVWKSQTSTLETA